MEDPGATVAEFVASPPHSAPKSKLDTLSKDDLIKFTKKQVAAFQKMKSRCADLEKEFEAFKEHSKNMISISDDSTLIQELTERMDALLLEKAETQQSLALSRKELERTKQLAKDDVTELGRVIEDHKRTIDILKTSIDKTNSEHQEEVEYFQKLLKEREDSDRELDSEREKQNLTEEASGKYHPEDDKCSLEVKLKTLQVELEAIQERNSKEIAELQESHQNELTEAQQEVENLKEEMSQRSMQHEEELRALEEDCEIERERLLLLQEELTEQLALKDSYLQDVQEEDEEPGRSSGIAKMLALSACSQAELSHVDGELTEGGKLKAALEDLHAQNTMLQDELTLLSNVKSELEAELERVKDEFQMEREEMDFKINELQMTRESDLTTATLKVMNVDSQTNVSGESKDSVQAQNTLEQDEQEKLRSQCEALIRERDSARADLYNMKDILQKLETELGQKANDFVIQYTAMKEQGANTVQNLQYKTEQLSQEKEELSAKVREVTEERNILMETVQDLMLKLESYSADEQKLQSSAEKQTALVQELNQSVKELSKHNEEILSQLQIKENLTEELNEMVNILTEERHSTQSLLQLREAEMQELKSENAKEIETLQEGKQAAQLLKEETEKELRVLKMEMKTEMQVLKEERDKIEARLKEEVRRMQEAVSSSEMTLKDISSENACLREKLEGTLTTLSQTQKEQELLASKLATVEAQLEQQSFQKSDLEAKVNSLTEEAEPSQNSGRELEAQSEELKNTKEEMVELQIRLEELEKERNMLRSRLEEIQVQRRSEAMPHELQALEQEKEMLRENLEETLRDTGGLLKDLQDMKSLNEKLCAENQMLQGQIQLMAREKEEKVQADIDVLERERTEFKEQLMDKDSVLSQLRADITSLQDSAAKSAPEEYKAMEITQKIGELEKDNKEKDEMINKIKAVAVKAKKELDTSKKEVATLKEEITILKADREKMNISMKDIIHGAEGYKNLQIDYDKQTEQLDKEREKVEAAERQITDLTKHLSSAVTQVELLNSEKEDLLAALETSRSMVKQIEAQIHELKKQSTSLARDLVAEKAMKEQKIKELSRATKDADELKAQLGKQQKQLQQTAQELEQLRKEAQQNSLLDMEMADYERLVKELNAKLSEKDEYSEALKAQITRLTEKEETHKQEIETLKSQLDQGEEKNSNIKQLLVNSKKELSDAKKQENSLALLQASLKGELEANQQKLESSKIEVCDLTTERHRLQDQLRSALEQQQRTSSSLQQRINSLQQERDIAKAELVATAEEFESYKVRVHNVLKQQKSKFNGQNESDAGKLEREQLLTQVDQLRSRLGESQQSLQSSTAELQQLQIEHDTLLERHNKILQENVSKEAELRERLLSVQSENVDLRSELAQAQADSSSQIEAQRQTHREQLRKLQDDHRATVETLQGQLTRVEEQFFNLQSQNSSVLVQSSRKSVDAQRRTADQNQAGLGPVALSDLQSMAREEGEGMETTENESTSSASLLSLEHLLMSPDPKQEPFVWTVEPTKDELSQKLSTATRSLAHMNSLLHETEATNAVLMEQINLLKSEVRRLERNQEREKSVANLEYLKNVLLQFIFLRSGSERQALLPVIHTMLQLSPDEKSKLAAIAQGEEEASGTRGSGWGSYLHSWSGIR
ncbi:GRIP and coiled-coil domain-containing protein 2 isoform X1 [Phyllopteryx taeniolatus]|uniref:GRIP and coiled-coil domain-containing protein 2 isoform X1 n=2 Tax=Phyllopteryx taeniolatus TaxID=161469 RepID=UPI002AD3E35A|nr:GRIP and coiled-coil domain-containing protein 2 isoform X1 [Phyllopteryx taeniolatus]